ncbi:RNA-directed DNA polymerase (Reverse transcriptase), partial [Trifolium medium]|nr:RNA-directed DNA polymerase (Reverse transcriptase) [Trifolium medium]
MIRWGIGETRVEAVQRELQDRDEALRQLRDQLLRAQNRMKTQADIHRQSVVTRIHAKLAARYFGPYPVVDRVGAVAYRLKLPERSKIHPVFHVSLLKKAVGNYHQEADLPDELEGEDM